MISVTILGAGNVATHLFKAFYASGEVEVRQWYNRSLDKIQSYKNLVDTVDDLSQLKEADIYIISVSDDAVSEITQQLPFSDRLVVHTSGSVNVYDMDKKNRRGVFYPLQSFTKSSKMDFKQIPICLETLIKADYKILKKLASTISLTVKRINSDQRAALHLAAVFVNNFTNQLYRVAHEITESTGAEFDLLKPLILETANKVQELSPYRAQTGPALRNDKKTIKRHLNLIENQQHQAIYKLMTQAIQKTHGR